MKTYKEVQKTVTTQRLVSVTCDVCKRVFPDEKWGAPGHYDILETEFSLKEGNSYPEGGDYIKTTLDICPDCIRNLFDELRAKGVTLRQEEVEW